VLERSWSLLAPQERDALSALSVFRGGFGHGAAVQVAGVRLPLLSSLVDRSLLAVDAGGRFGMHPLVAVEAAHRLDAEGTRAPALRLRHAEYFARHLAALEPHTRGDPRRLVAGLDAEYGNCLLAWQHAVALARFDLVAAMTPALWSFFDNRGRVREGIALLAPALALPEAGAAAQRAQARLRNGLAWLLHRSGDQDRALASARAGLAAAIACGDLDAQVGCDVAIGACLGQLGRMEEGRVHYERAVVDARAAGLRQPLAYALGNLGVALFELGESQAAIAATEQAIAGCRDVGDQFNVGAYLVNLGTMWRDLDDPVQAREVLQRADRHCAEFGLHAVRMYVALSLGPLLAAAGQADAGRRLLDGAVETARRTGMRWVEWDARRGLVRVDLQEHDFDRALARLAGVAREARELGATHDLVCALRLHGRMLARIGRIGDARALWQMLAAHPAAFPREKVGLAADIAALPAGAAEPIGFDAALDRLVAEAEATARAAKR
jgi:tetratricopeptide (TPR) repeat protein